MKMWPCLFVLAQIVEPEIHTGGPRVSQCLFEFPTEVFSCLCFRQLWFESFFQVVDIPTTG